MAASLTRVVGKGQGLPAPTASTTAGNGIKDLCTYYEVGNTQGVLDTDLDGFIKASLKQGV
jgi:protein subunit release factor B